MSTQRFGTFFPQWSTQNCVISDKTIMVVYKQCMDDWKNMHVLIPLFRISASAEIPSPITVKKCLNLIVKVGESDTCTIKKWIFN